MQSPRVFKVGELKGLKTSPRLFTVDSVERIFEDLKCMSLQDVAEKYALPAATIGNLLAHSSSWNFRIRQKNALQVLRNLEAQAR